MGYSRNRSGWMWFVILTVVFGLALTGCGGSEEAMEGEEEGYEDAQPLGEEQPLGAEEEPAEEEEEEDADADALTSFIGAAPEEAKPAQPQQSAPAQGGQLQMYERQIEDLRTENTTLKQRLVKLEQDNRTLNTMVSENETKIQATRDRADSLEAALMARPVAAAQPMMAEDEAPVAVVETETHTSEPMAISSYEDALRAFNARRYDEAIAGWTAMLNQGVSKDLEDNCVYWIGEANFQKRRYADALASFEKVMAYKTSEKKGHAEYMMAQCHERLGDKVKAKAGYEKVVKEYPMSDIVRKAKERWARL